MDQTHPLSKKNRIELSSKLITKLIELISASASGEYDGQPMQSVSIKASGRRFVIKGWVDKEIGPAIRFSAPWGDLGNGYVLYQASPDADWEDVEEVSIDLDFDWDRAELSLRFLLDINQLHLAVFSGHPR